MERRFHRGFTAAEKTELGSEAWMRGDAGKQSVDFSGGSARWDCPAERRLQVGIDACGTRGDFQRCYGTSIGPVDRSNCWPLTLDGEPGNEPQWRL